eukprot:10137256-Alexandrium_andersonii.AAC.1
MAARLCPKHHHRHQLCRLIVFAIASSTCAAFVTSLAIPSSIGPLYLRSKPPSLPTIPMYTAALCTPM